jgi:hypothetical protein
MHYITGGHSFSSADIQVCESTRNNFSATKLKVIGVVACANGPKLSSLSERGQTK